MTYALPHGRASTTPSRGESFVPHSSSRGHTAPPRRVVSSTVYGEPFCVGGRADARDVFAQASGGDARRHHGHVPGGAGGDRRRDGDADGHLIARRAEPL